MPRIVSLLPSATEIVCSLGFEGELVGRSHECDFPPGIKDLPVLTRAQLDSEQSSGAIDREVKELLEKGLSLYRVDVDKLQQLKPDLIVTQTQCEVCAVSEVELGRALQSWVGTPVRIVSLRAQTLAGLWQDLDSVAEALEAKSRGASLIAGLQARIARVAEQAIAIPQRPRVACIEWLDPLMAAGNWIPELVEMAGGENLFGSAGDHSPWLDWEQLRAAEPEAIVVMPCGFDIPRTERELPVLSGHAEWPKLAAVRQGQVYLVDGNQYFNRPGPRLVESLEILTEILHPQSFPPRTQGVAWKVWSNKYT